MHSHKGAATELVCIMRLCGEYRKRKRAAALRTWSQGTFFLWSTPAVTRPCSHWPHTFKVWAAAKGNSGPLQNWALLTRDRAFVSQQRAWFHDVLQIWNNASHLYVFMWMLPSYGLSVEFNITLSFQIFSIDLTVAGKHALTVYHSSVADASLKISLNCKSQRRLVKGLRPLISESSNKHTQVCESKEKDPMHNPFMYY